MRIKMRGKYVVNKSVQAQQKKAMRISYRNLFTQLCLKINFHVCDTFLFYVGGFIYSKEIIVQEFDFRNGAQSLINHSVEFARNINILRILSS